MIFNVVSDGVDVREAFETVLAFVGEHTSVQVSPKCRLGTNEVYERIKGTDTSLAELASDTTDYKRLIAACKEPADKLALAQKLATRRLASGVVPELDDCFAALELT